MKRLAPVDVLLAVLVVALLAAATAAGVAYGKSLAEWQR